MRQVVSLAAFLLLVFAPLHISAQSDQRCFPETNQCISGRIRAYWEQNGGLDVFGYPITPQQQELIEGRPLQVQWFERNRLELHPENSPPYDVLLGRVGVDRLAQQGRDWFTFPKSAEQPGCRFFPETGHNVCGAILAAWRANGLELDGIAGFSEGENLALFGLPLSGVQVEEIEGRPYNVQWFERARFELHPENPPPFDVLLGLLGNEIRTAGSVAPPPAPPPSDPCADVPDPVSARIRPSTCVRAGEPIEIDIFGFQPNEQIGFWLTAPDGSVYGTVETYDVGPTGSVEGLPMDTDDLPPGLWFWVFEGTSSKHRAIVYFKIVEDVSPPPAPPAPTPVPPPTTPPAPNCDPSYPDVCIPPPPPNLECDDIPYRDFRVLQPDPHNFDADRDGIGCESSPPPPPPPPTAQPRRNCDPSYPDVCIPPPPPDLDCGDISHRRFRVLPPDPHRFDNDGDGVGCESG